MIKSFILKGIVIVGLLFISIFSAPPAYAMHNISVLPDNFIRNDGTQIPKQIAPNLGLQGRAYQNPSVGPDANGNLIGASHTYTASIKIPGDGNGDFDNFHITLVDGGDRFHFYYDDNGDPQKYITLPNGQKVYSDWKQVSGLTTTKLDQLATRLVNQYK